MLFNSATFIFVYLPLTLAGFFLIARRSAQAAAAWLAFASLAFYAYWDWRYVFLLLASIAFNYSMGMAIARAQGAQRTWRFAFAIAANLLVLGYFKYSAMAVETVNAALDASFVVPAIVLPLGISFFTFTQIAYLADVRAAKAREPRFVHYALFVTYFPHLIAGPVLHHKEMMPQFASPRTYRPQRNALLLGTAIFVIGLAKKVLIADNLAPYAAPVFADATHPTLFFAWAAVLAYAFQIYFDFSGYSDMAIGLSRMFGIKLPLNFDSPYKSRNIVEFWRRWHMTLSRFLRDYLYVPLGGNRHGPARRYANLMATMLLGGLWHGAGWSFLVWGGLHGLYLCINHLWQRYVPPSDSPSRSARFASVALTFFVVTIAWVFFRAPTFTVARDVLGGMFGVHGVALPEALAGAVPGLRALANTLGVQTVLGGGSAFVGNYAWVIGAAAIAFCAPNTQEIARRFAPALAYGAVGTRIALRFSLAWPWAVALGLLAATSLLSLSNPSEFLYFQF